MKKINCFVLIMVVISCAVVSCSSRGDSLTKARHMSGYDCVDSLACAWEYLQEANHETNNVVGLDIAKIIVHKTDSLFDNFLQKPDLDGAARCLDLMEQVVSFYGEMCFIPESSNEDNVEPSTIDKQEKLEVRKERLADSYYRQARSAEKLWKKFNDSIERQRMEDSDKMAHKYNPDKY